MKKLLFAFTVLFSTCMFSCSNAKTSTDASTDSISDSELIDTVAIDSIL